MHDSVDGVARALPGHVRNADWELGRNIPDDICKDPPKLQESDGNGQWDTIKIVGESSSMEG
jgi:hypothetical protein